LQSGVAVDVARLAMEKADLVVGEINDKMPFTYGDTFVPLSEFDFWFVRNILLIILNAGL
jgi:hypothetical protein